MGTGAEYSDIKKCKDLQNRCQRTKKLRLRARAFIIWVGRVVWQQDAPGLAGTSPAAAPLLSPPLSPQRLLTDLSVTPLRVLRVSHPRGRTPSPKQNSPKRFHAEAVCWAKAHFLAESRPKIQVVLLQSNSTTDFSPTPAETSAHTNSPPTSSPPQNQTAQSEPHTSRVRAPATDTHPIATTTPQPQAASYTKPHSASRGHNPYLPTIPKSKT